MLKSNHGIIRTLLKKHNDGLTTMEVSLILEKDSNHIRQALRTMPDTYIDRWTQAQYQNPSEAVWCIVVPPEDCPKPERKKSERPTKLRSVEQRELSQILHGFVHQNAGTTS